MYEKLLTIEYIVSTAYAAGKLDFHKSNNLLFRSYSRMNIHIPRGVYVTPLAILNSVIAPTFRRQPLPSSSISPNNKKREERRKEIIIIKGKTVGNRIAGGIGTESSEPAKGIAR